jgi:hypothetical protein
MQDISAHVIGVAAANSVPYCISIVVTDPISLPASNRVTAGFSGLDVTETASDDSVSVGEEIIFPSSNEVIVAPSADEV